MTKLLARLGPTLIVVLVGLGLGGALWALLGSSRLDGQAASPTDPESRRCHASAFAAFEQTSEGDATHRVVPADRNPVLPGVEVEVGTSSGSSSSSTFVALRELAGGRSLEATFETSFERMVIRHPVPGELQGAANEGWRRVVEEAAFETICTQPDPSLARLLSADERLRWLPGVPEMPQSYALFVEPAPGEPYWIEYLGSNHRRLTTDTFSDRLEVIDRSGNLELLRSGHGAAVVDLERKVYAWVYVFGGGRKLRWPSVIGGKLEDDAVILQIDQPVVGEPNDSVRIDLASGAIRPAR